MLEKILSGFGYHFSLFYSLSARSCLATVTAFVLVLIFQKLFVSFLKHKNFLEKITNNNQRLYAKHKDKGNTPTMGGLLMMFAVIVTLILWTDLSSVYIKFSFAVIFYFGSLGFWDDYKKCFDTQRKGLSVRYKLFLEMLGAFIIGALIYWNHNGEYSLSVPFLNHIMIPMGLIYFFLPFIIIVSSTNAVNLTDGLDGLAAGTLIIAFSVYFVLSYIASHVQWSQYLGIQHIQGAGEIAVLCSSVMGSCLGFLWFNAYPASLFMGDTGALPLGALLGSIALFLRQELLLILVGGIFVIESLSSLIQIFYYRRTGKRFFLIAPLHHHFQMKNIPENKIVIRFWIVGIMFSILALLTLKLS